MDRFPPLISAKYAVRLPLCDTTAVELGRSLLCGDRNSSFAAIADTLRCDPALTLWCVCQAGEDFQKLPSLEQIARWFLFRGFNHLLSANEPAASDYDVAKLIERAVGTAVLAASKSAEPNDSERAHLLALLVESAELLRAFAANPPTGLPVEEELLPAWLSASLKLVYLQESHGSRLEATVGAARLAVQAGFDSLAPDERHAASDAGRRAVQRFQAEIPSARGTLPILCAKLLRLQKLESEFQSTLEREKLASLKQLAYGASHEINNPLANISTRAQTLLRDEEDPERRRQLSTINSQAFRAHEMIADMMLFAHPPSLRVERTDVHALAEQVVDECHADAQRQGTQLDVDASAEVPMWNVDPTQIAVAIKALVRNSIEALGSGGHVLVSLCLSGGERDRDRELAIKVTDDGPGISEAVRRHLFDPFYSGREAGRGLGFGLSKTWRIAEMHGGDIIVDSNSSGGASLTIKLPEINPEMDSTTELAPERLEAV